MMPLERELFEDALESVFWLVVLTLLSVVLSAALAPHPDVFGPNAVIAPPPVLESSS